MADFADGAPQDRRGSLAHATAAKKFREKGCGAVNAVKALGWACLAQVVDALTLPDATALGLVAEVVEG